MKILIYSDVHGNLPAFEKMLEIEGVCDGYVCTGILCLTPFQKLGHG